jgi:antitoxin component YwqK of YwqJK toxin-antitoxin module
VKRGKINKSDRGELSKMGGRGIKVFKNGKVVLGYFDKATVDGFIRVYNADGKWWQDVQLRNQKLHGKSAVLYRDGIVWEGEYKDGKKEGRHRYWDENG